MFGEFKGIWEGGDEEIIIPRKVHDDVSSPHHYTAGSIEVIDFIRAWDMSYLEGNIIKYICRYPYKGEALTDLLKAKRYLEWLIEEVREYTNGEKD
jgi:hypothetical protein